MCDSFRTYKIYQIIIFQQCKLAIPPSPSCGMRLFCLPELLCPPPRGHTLRSEYSIDAWDPGPQSPPSHSEIQQEELDCYLPVDFSVLLARRQQFVEEIRHKRFRPKKKKKKKGYVLGLPSWFFANADDNPLSAAVTKADISYLNCEDEDNAEDSFPVAEEEKHGDKELIPSCAVQKYDVEQVDKINERRVDLLTTLVEENHKEFFSGEGITDYLRPQPLLALDNVTHSCILTTRCYHRTYRTDDITETDPSYRELEPENMVQIFSLTLPETYPCSISIYGIFAIRDVLHPGRNYLFRRSRDNSITIHPGSTLPLISPCRGIYALTRALLDVDLRIKHDGDDESADEKFVAGYFELLVECKYDMRFCQRLHDGIRSHFLDVDGRYIGWSIAATVIASADIPYPCHVTFKAYTSGFDDEITIFDDPHREGELQFRHVVAVKVLCTLELCLKLDGMCYSHSFKAGVDSKPVKFGPMKALVVWSVMNRHRFWW
ncbi:uncharacterized protein [Lolium perenne]|uniref:uncharacterized protein n=1 Tax=Lolium perenne TaxID=4522 RepID=UPI0021F5E7E4|nr:uncharacterized protein LOC127342156 [Lolium perenne]